MFFELSKQRCVYTPLTLSDEEKGEIGGMTIFNDKGKIKLKEQEGIAQITRDKGEALSKENPESFIMNSYTTLSSAVGALDSLGNGRTVDPMVGQGARAIASNLGSNLSPHPSKQGKEILVENDQTIKEKYALASTVIKKIGRNRNIYNITFDGPNPFNIFEMKSDVTKPSDYLTMTFKLHSKDMAKLTDDVQQLKTDKLIVP